MRTDLSVRAVHVQDMRMEVHIRAKILTMDYPMTSSADPTPLEVLMASLASCAGCTFHSVLTRKMGTRVKSLEVEVNAERRGEHPSGLTDIEIIYRLRGESLNSEVVERALRMAEDQFCPVLDMLRPGTRIRSSWQMH
ncbi:MAG: OsmC family protein [Terracidiphilus sp.]|jgi:putative redox protein